jgi:uncharacterized protein YdhG (YjbR/CyaY superfamily)
MSASRNVAKTVDDYIARYPDDVQERLGQVRSLIRSVAPEALESISYAIPAFKVNGKPLIYVAGYAKHIGVYPLPEEPSPELEAEIAPYVAGKGTLQFPHSEPLPLDLIERVVVRRKQHITGTE